LLQEQLQQAGHKVTAVLPGNTFQRLDASTYTIAPHKKEDYAALLKHLQQLNLPPDRVVHMWSVTAEMENPLAETAVRKALTGGFYSVLYMVQALGDQQMDTGLSIHIVSSYLHDVLGGEMLHPGKAAVLGPLHVVTQEYEHLKACSIDVSPASPADLLARQLFLEVTSPTDDSMVAYRGTSRWVQAYQPISLPASRGETVRLRHQGVYLITGAFGGLGSDLALFLAEQVQARLVLVGRTTLPPRANWPAFVADAANEKKVRRQIQLVQALEALGAEVLTAAADVADREQMQPVMAAASQRFGTIHGVFHLAGVPSAGLMQLKTAEIAETVFRPKILGTLVLDALLRDEPLDFTVLYSSINAIAGGLGEVDYCAANAFLDAFAHYSQQRRTGSTVSINWGLWQWDAWQTSLADSMPKVYEQVKLIRQTYGITFAEGREALTRIWRTSLPQVIAITLDLQAARQHWHTPSLQDYLESVSQTRDTSVYQRPNLRTPYVAPRQETEQKIANIWAKCLAIEKVGVHDHFLELGGNSLLGMVIISHLKKEFHIELSAAALYEGPTVSELHKLIFPEETAVAPLADRNERGQKRKQMRSRRKAHERSP
jgi:NAD(P)-dependent dehydrogenase (short-subunit alcohol dehydrogenase family)/acyl carrier protein